MNKIKLVISKWWATVTDENKRLFTIIPVSILVGIILCSFSSCTEASEQHYYKPIIQTEYCAPTAVAAASGQHNYKATTDLQWSTAAVYLDAEGCDDTAVSAALGLQNGNVFNSINFSSNGDENIIGITASGTF